MSGASPAPLIERAAIIGVGLMGGSLGMALRSGGIAAHVTGFDSSAEVAAQAVAAGALNSMAPDLATAVRGADAIFLAAPVDRVPHLLHLVANDASPDAIVTDLGSTKGRIVEVGVALLGDRFVGGHPMAGSEASGIGAANARLYSNAAWALVRPEPFETADLPAAGRLAAIVSALGARPIPMSAGRHDRLVALVSHLPHLISFAYARSVDTAPCAAAARDLAAGSYRDLTRISTADRRLWDAIFRENRVALLEALDRFQVELEQLKSAIVGD